MASKKKIIKKTPVKKAAASAKATPPRPRRSPRRAASWAERKKVVDKFEKDNPGLTLWPMKEFQLYK